MKYKSALITTAAGSLQSLAFNTSPTGPQIKARLQRGQPVTPAQFTTQQILGAISKEWSALASANQDNWRLVAATINLTDILGNIYHPTGHNLYIQLNSNQYFSGQTRTSTAPLYAETVPAIASLTLSASSNPASTPPQVFTATLGSNPSGYALVIRATRIYSTGVAAPAASAFKLLGYVGAGFGTTIDLLADYLAILPTFAAGKNVSVQMFLVSPAGFASPIVTAATTITT